MEGRGPSPLGAAARHQGVLASERRGPLHVARGRCQGGQVHRGFLVPGRRQKGSDRTVTATDECVIDTWHRARACARACDRTRACGCDHFRAKRLFSAQEGEVDDDG